MMKEIVEDYIISEFDCDEPDRYVLSRNGKHWNISMSMKLIIENMNKCNDFSELQALIEKEQGNVINTSLIETVYNDFLVKNNFFVDDQNNNNSLQVAKNDLLWGRFTLVSEKNISKLKVLRWLFSKKTVAINVLLFVLINFISVALFRKQLSLITKDLFFGYGFVKFVLINAIVVLIHEYGHAVAALKCGLNPKRIGGAFYFIKPVMFTDVTSIWRISRSKRQMVNFGGIYFQLIVSYILLIVFASIGDIQSLNITIISELFILANFNIFIKSDGYWILCDYLGVANLHLEILSFGKEMIRKEKTSNKRRNNILSIYLAMYAIAIIIMLWLIKCNLIDAINTIILALNKGISRNNIGAFVYGLIFCILFIYGLYKLFIRINKIMKYD